MAYLIVFLGGGLEAALRHGVNVLFTRLFGAGFPFATLFENVSGSFVMGCWRPGLRSPACHRTGGCS